MHPFPCRKKRRFVNVVAVGCVSKGPGRWMTQRWWPARSAPVASCLWLGLPMATCVCGTWQWTNSMQRRMRMTWESPAVPSPPASSAVRAMSGYSEISDLYQTYYVQSNALQHAILLYKIRRRKKNTASVTFHTFKMDCTVFQRRNDLLCLSNCCAV